MKNNNGNDNQKFTFAARNARRASFAASGGIGAPCSALALFQAINFFWQRQTIPQTFRHMIVPSPPPTAMESVRLEALCAARSERTSQEITVTTIATSSPSTHPLPSGLSVALSRASLTK